MKKTLLAIISLLIFSINAIAQSSMTDSQVIDFVMKEQKAGTSQAQIVTKLMQRGVDISQIRRIKKQYERQMKDKGLGSVAPETNVSGDSRLRTNNGDRKENANQSANSTTQKVSNGISYRHTYDSDDEDYIRMRREFSTLLPDSLEFDEDEILDLKKKKGPKVFGRDIFNNKKISFEPNMNIATPQNYVLGPGDKVYIDIYGATQKTHELTVSPEGEVVVEDYGPIKVGGMTVDQANSKLRSTLGSRYASSNVKLSVGQTRTIMVNVMGEVQTPGSYTLSAFSTVFHALYMAGGINDIGTLRNIKVFRQGKLLSQVDVYDFILNGKLTGNVRLADNDVIVVGPYDCIVNVTGKVKRPMLYEMKKSESMQSLIRYAGGFANDAYTQSVRVVRKTGRQYAVFNVTEFDMSSFHVADGDSVSVDSLIPRYENMVELKGEVFRPGMYQLGNDVNTVGSLIKMAEGVTEDAFTTRAVMHRMREDRTLEVISVDLAGILAGTSPDVPLQNEDVLFVPTRQISQEERTITIHGEVNYPGIYKYAENETLEDFVLQAGGLKESASTMKVDISRRKYNSDALTSNKEISETFSFKLKDGFVIDGEESFKLMPFDEVYVRKNPTYNIQKNITIEGQINFAGNYTLTKKDTRLSDIIEQAGGVNQFAYVKGARLERRLTPDERTRMEAMLKMARNNSSSKDSIDISKLDISDTYSVGIELDKAIANPGSNYDVVLREGDRIIIPEYNGTVKVNGAVMYPNTLAYTKGKSAKWYIKHAGGYGNMARKSKAYIIHQSGMVEKLTSSTKVSPGSEIVVPEKTSKERMSTAEYVALGTGFASLATMIATIASLWK